MRTVFFILKLSSLSLFSYYLWGQIYQNKEVTFYKLWLFITMKLMKVVADRVCQEDVVKACHQEMGSLQEPMVLAGHCDSDKMGGKVAGRWYSPYISKWVKRNYKILNVCQHMHTTKVQKGQKLYIPFQFLSRYGTSLTLIYLVHCRK